MQICQKREIKNLHENLHTNPTTFGGGGVQRVKTKVSPHWQHHSCQSSLLFLKKSQINPEKLFNEI